MTEEMERLKDRVKDLESDVQSLRLVDSQYNAN